MPPVSRRTFLLGSAGALALAACGGDDDDDNDEAESSSSTRAASGGLAVVKVFAPQQPSGLPLRLPLALADSQGALLDDVPESIIVRYGLDGSTERSEPLTLQRHSEGIPTPYYPFVVTFPELGDYRIEIEAGDTPASTTVSAVEPTQVPVVPGPGSALIALQTPTADDARGVEPICTREPACPFHDQTLEAAMASGKAIAFIISTPQFCQTAICGPVLDLLVDRQEQYAEQIAFVHAEVYKDSTAQATTEAVQTYGLTWEPSLFLAVADGTIASRLDYTYDGVELDEALSKLVQ